MLHSTEAIVPNLLYELIISNLQEGFIRKPFYNDRKKVLCVEKLEKAFSFLIVKSSYLSYYNIFHMIGYVSLVSIVPEESNDCLIKSISYGWITVNNLDKYAKIISKVNTFYLKQQL